MKNKIQLVSLPSSRITGAYVTNFEGFFAKIVPKFVTLESKLHDFFQKCDIRNSR